MIEKDDRCWKLIGEYNKYLGGDKIDPCWSSGQMLYAVCDYDEDYGRDVICIFEDKIEAHKFQLFLLETRRGTNPEIILMHPVKRYEKQKG